MKSQADRNRLYEDQKANDYAVDGDPGVELDYSQDYEGILLRCYSEDYYPKLTAEQALELAAKLQQMVAKLREGAWTS